MNFPDSSSIPRSQILNLQPISVDSFNKLSQDRLCVFLLINFEYI